ncbi:hypothetical protein SB57_08465 [Lactobacillus delbrueckii subsp. bulgaricus]|nr:hypothetical protein SB57_08465 [Lactobacillus delbrueckii subsp. bulgaricus]
MSDIVVVDPVNGHVKETEQVDDQLRDKWLEGLEAGFFWGPYFQDHDGDDDGQNAIAERLQAVLAHNFPPKQKYSIRELRILLLHLYHFSLLLPKGKSPAKPGPISSALFSS